MDAPSPEQIEQLDEMLDQIRLRFYAENNPPPRPIWRSNELLGGACCEAHTTTSAAHCLGKRRRGRCLKIEESAAYRIRPPDANQVQHLPNSFIRDRAYSEVEQPTAPATAESAAKIEEDFGEVAAQI